MKKLRARAALLLVLLIAFGSSVTTGQAAALSAAKEDCAPVDIGRKDFVVQTTSTLPMYPGQPADLDVHAVLPIYAEVRSDECATAPRRAAILIHGAMTEGTTSFDLRFGGYSLMKALARAGIAAFAVNLLGYGFSTRFGLNDPCNASTVNQTTFLTPNPLDPSDPLYVPCDPRDLDARFRFTNTYAAVDQLDAVVDEVRQRRGFDAVHLFGWSRGGVVIGAYAGLHAEKVTSLAFLASGYDFGTNPLPPCLEDRIPCPALLLVRDREAMFNEWTPQLDSANCPGQRTPGILEAIWRSVQARDPIGASWGSSHPRTGGIQRAPSWDTLGWNPARASSLTTPSLVMTGLLDTTNRPEKEIRLYNDLGSQNKVLIKIACASHQALWEGSNAPGWKGPHGSIHGALVEWITSGAFRGSPRGSFLINTDGSISSE
jgi:pimeloyl-ACP methyl ester carboxylesterase